MHSIITAILELEQKATQALSTIQREKDKLPARIAAETSHIDAAVARETELAILKLKEESKKFTEARIASIQEESAAALANFQRDFDNQRANMRIQLFKRATTWMP